MKNTVVPHKFWRPFLDCMPQLFFRPQYVWFPVHLKGHLIPLCYETLVVNWQNWLFTLFHQSRYVLSPNPIVLPPCSKGWMEKQFFFSWTQRGTVAGVGEFHKLVFSLYYYWVLHQILRDHFLYEPCQWEVTLQCNIISHWLGPYIKWFLGSVKNLSQTNFVCLTT